MPDLYGEGNVTIAGKDLNDYLEEKLLKLVSK